MKLRFIISVLILTFCFSVAVHAGEPEITALFDVSVAGDERAFDRTSETGALRDFSDPRMAGKVVHTGDKLLKVNLIEEGKGAYIHGDLGIKERRDISGYDFIRFYIENESSKSLHFHIRFDVYVEPDNPLWTGIGNEQEGYNVNILPQNFFFESMDGEMYTKNGRTAELPGNFKGWLYVALDENMEASRSMGDNAVWLTPGNDLYRLVSQYVFFFGAQETDLPFYDSVCFGDMQLLNYDKEFKYDDIPTPTEEPTAAGAERPSSTKRPAAIVTGSGMTPEPASSYEYYIILAALIAVFAIIILLSSLIGHKRKVKLDKNKDK